MEKKEEKEKLSKNKILKGIVIVLLVVIFFIIRAKYTSMGTDEQFLPVSSTTVTVPKFSIYKKECCMYSVTFKSFQNIELLKKELDKIMKKYEKITCDGNAYYYDEEHDITITEYGTKKGGFLNEFYITFDKGKRKECSENKPMEAVTSYIDNDTNHSIYTNCRTCFTLWNKNEKHITIEKWVQDNGIDNLIEELEKEANTGKIKKEIYKDGGSILYQSKEIGILKCNTLEGNKDIYIGNGSLTYQDEYCK